MKHNANVMKELWKWDLSSFTSYSTKLWFSLSPDRFFFFSLEWEEIQFILALYALTHMQLMMDFRAEMGCYTLKAIFGDADELNGLQITTFWHTCLSDDPQSESESRNSISRQTWNESVVSRSATHEWASRTVSQLMLSIVRHTFYRRRSSSHLRSSLNGRRLKATSMEYKKHQTWRTSINNWKLWLDEWFLKVITKKF